MEKIKQKFKKIPKHVYVLLAIVLIGTFFRTYNFRDWMRFEGDQARDAEVADRVILGKDNWPLMGPHMNHTSFNLGPIYYHFQIMSAKIFGNTPTSVAYPDLLFSILSIPLLFFLLKKYFNISLSLMLTGLYAVLFFSIEYSRFAWNVNSIPFFSILFLLALMEFLLQKEKTRWIWIISLGTAIGIGIQLHAILLFLFPTVALIIFFILMKKKWKSKNLWKKWGIILMIIFILNLSQIASEFKNNFNNSKTLTYLMYDQVARTENTLVRDFIDSSVCHVEANVIIVSSYGSRDKCDFSYAKLFSEKYKKYWRIVTEDKNQSIIMLLGLIFSAFGYFSLFSHYRKEQEKEKKYFLGIIFLYSAISFFVLMMVGDTLRPRYFLHTIFIPLIFVGLMIIYLSKKFPSGKNRIAIFIILFFAGTNLISIASETKRLVEKNRSEERYIVLGEAEALIDYIKSNSNNQKKVYISGSPGYIWEFYLPLSYIANKEGFELIQTEHRYKFPENQTIFYITPKIREDSEIDGHQIEDLNIFGNVNVYKLKN